MLGRQRIHQWVCCVRRTFELAFHLCKQMPATRLERVCTPVDGLAVCTSHASTCMNGGEDLVCCAFRFDPFLQVADYALNNCVVRATYQGGFQSLHLADWTRSSFYSWGELWLKLLRLSSPLSGRVEITRTSTTHPSLIIPKCILFGNCTNYISVTIVIV